MFSRCLVQFLVFLASSLSFYDKWNFVTEAVLTETPSNVVAPLGTRVVLKCSTDNSDVPIDWYFTAKDNNSHLKPIPYPIYLNTVVTFKVNATYTVDVSNSKKTHSLVIKSLNWRDAGQYLCHDDASAGEKAYANVTVLDPIPMKKLDVKKSGEGSPGFHVMELTFTFYGHTVPTLLWNNRTTWNQTAENPSNTTTSPAAAVPRDVSYKTITTERHNCSDCLRFCYLGSGKSDEVDVWTYEVMLSNSTTVVSVVHCKKNKEGNDPALLGLSLHSFAIFATACALLSVVVVILSCCLCYYRKVIQDLRRNKSGRNFPLRYEFLRRQDETSTSTSAAAAASQTPDRSSVIYEEANRRWQEPTYTSLSRTRSLEDAPVDYRSAAKYPQRRIQV